MTPELPEKLKKSEEPPPLPAKRRIGRLQHEEQVPLPVFQPDARPRLNRQISTASQRGNRIIQMPHTRVASGNRRQIGKGLVGRWLNRTIKRKRLTSAVKEQIDNLEDHRYVSFFSCLCSRHCIALLAGKFFWWKIIYDSSYRVALLHYFVMIFPLLSFQTLFHVLDFICSNNYPHHHACGLRFCSCWI